MKAIVKADAVQAAIEKTKPPTQLFSVTPGISKVSGVLESNPAFFFLSVVIFHFQQQESV